MCIAETECVYCAVRTVSSNIVQVTVSLQKTLVDLLQMCVCVCVCVCVCARGIFVTRRTKNEDHFNTRFYEPEPKQLHGTAATTVRAFERPTAGWKAVNCHPKIGTQNPHCTA